MNWGLAQGRPHTCQPDTACHGARTHSLQAKLSERGLPARYLDQERSADLITELISGDHINMHVHEFANARKAELRSEFKERKHNDDWSGWLYSKADNRPQGLGYWTGNKIAKAYYDKAPDKVQAIRDILNIDDFSAFLVATCYDPSDRGLG